MSCYIRSNGRLKPLVLVGALALSLTSAPAFAGKANLNGMRSGQTYSQFIVKYRAGTPERKDPAARTRSLDRAAQAVMVTMTPTTAKGQPAGPERRALRVRHERRMGIGADAIRTERPLSRNEAERMMRKLAADPSVEYVEISGIKRAYATPNDVRYPEQWHYANSPVGANVARAWDTSTGRGIVVAVLDTGRISHPDMDANYVDGYDFVSQTTPDIFGTSLDGDARDPDPTDAGREGHGVHVAGTIAAVTNNGIGVAGVAYGAKVSPIRVLGNLGFGSDVDIIDAVVWAAGGTVPGVPANRNPAEVINLSLGYESPCSLSYQEAFNYAVGQGSTVVVAAGNENFDASRAAPGNCANIITVAASDRIGNRANYSNYGAAVDITAPGGEKCVLAAGEFLPLGQTLDVTKDCRAWEEESAVLSLGIPSQGNATYDFMGGTSMAAPHVAGIVALMQAASATPKTPARIEAILKSTSRPIASAKCPGGCGAGLIDAAAAVAAAAAGEGGGNLEPLANFTVSHSGRTLSFIDTSIDNDGRIVSRLWDFGDGTTSTDANPSHTYAQDGAYEVRLTATDNGGASNFKKVLVGATNNVLTNGVPITGMNFTKGETRLFSMVVPAGARNLTFASSESFGYSQAAVHAKFGSPPTDDSYDCMRIEHASDEPLCTIASPKAGIYFVRLSSSPYIDRQNIGITGNYTAPTSNVAPVAKFTSTTSGLTASLTDTSTDSDGSIASRVWDFGDGTSSTATNPTKTYAAAGTYTVKLTVTDNGGLSNSKTEAVTVGSAPACGGTVLCNGVAVALPSATKGSLSSSYTLVVPAGKKEVVFTTSGGTGDADLYVRLGSAPTTSSYTCRSNGATNSETCKVVVPAAGGTYHVRIHAYAAYSGASLKGTISP